MPGPRMPARRRSLRKSNIRGKKGSMLREQDDLEEVESMRERERLVCRKRNGSFLKANLETIGTSWHRTVFHMCLTRAAQSTDVSVRLISLAAFSHPHHCLPVFLI